ncbi:unnamed protein product [Parajaminaea phylloscopi]
MAGSRFAYVRDFELPDPVLPSVYMVVRIDGKGFHKFSEAHTFTKPNDADALELMNHAARHVCQELKGEVTMAFGESDEYSFLLKKGCRLYNRRQSKITTHIVSLFTSAYVFYWSLYFPNKTLRHPPSFDGRLVMYPTAKEVRDYFSWRQADTHINNLYNTTFWALVLRSEPACTEAQAHEQLKGTVSAQKNEILYSRFGINYDREPAIFRKGTTVVWTEEEAERPHDGPSSSSNAAHASQNQNEVSATAETEARTNSSKKKKKRLRTLHVDIISDDFWHGTAAQGGAAVAEQQTPSEEDPKARPWEDAERIHGSGMGKWALV